MDYASGVLSSTEMEFSLSNSNNTTSSGCKSSLWSSRSVKSLLLGGLAASYGYSVGGAMERNAGKTAEIARVFGGLHMSDVGLEQAGEAPKFREYVLCDTEAATPMSSCIKGLIGGGIGALIVQNPLPLLVGLGECFPKASAQQMVGNEFQVNTYATDAQEKASVTSFSNGNFVVVWDSVGQDGSSLGIYGQLFYGNSTKLGIEFQVNTYTDISQQVPSVETFSNGNFVVTWGSLGQDSSDFGVFGQLFDENGAKLGNEFQVNTYTAGTQESPSAASFINGNFVVTWQSFSQDGSAEGIYGQIFYGNSSTLGNEFQVNSYTTNNQFSPSVASFSNGNFVVTWQSEEQDGSSYGIYGQLFDRNVTRIGNEFQVNTYTTGAQYIPSAVSFGNGNFVVVWSGEGQGDSYGGYGQLFDGNGTKLGSEFQVNTYTNDSQAGAFAASFNNGNFVVTWQSDGQDGSLHGIYGQLFDENANGIGNEFQINTYTTNYQVIPSVASFNNGNFVVVWQSRYQDGSEYGIYGQLFESPLITSSIISITSEVMRSSYSNSISPTTGQLASNTHTTPVTSGGYTYEPSPSGRDFSILPILLPVLGGVCLLTGIGTYLLFKRRNQNGSLPSVELSEEEENSNNDSQYANVSSITSKDNYANLSEDPSEYPKGYGNVPAGFVED